MTLTKALTLLAAVCLTTAADDAPGRYQLRANGPVCAVGPCPTYEIRDRVTGKVIHGDLRFELPPSENLHYVQVSGPDWDLLVDGELQQDASTHDVPVLRIRRIVGQVDRQ